MNGIETVLSVLEGGGYRRLAKPLTVAGTQFEFEAAASGTATSKDLVIVATGELPSHRLRRLVAVLARSLDVAQSTRPVTLMVLGGLTAGDRAELERHARVLTLDDQDPTVEQARQAAAVLLPLDLPTVSVSGRDPIGEVVEALGRHLTDEHMSLVDAAVHGPARVEAALRAFVDAAIPKDVHTDE